MGQESANLGYALVHYINTLPEGHVLREIAERTLLDYNKRQVAYTTVQNNQAHAVLRMKSKPRKSRMSQIDVYAIARANLKYLREKSKLKMPDFAAQFGYTSKGYRNMEQGSTRPNLYLIINVCIKYDISLDLFARQYLSEIPKN